MTDPPIRRTSERFVERVNIAARVHLTFSLQMRRRKRPLEEPDAGLVGEVRSFMKCNKLSQVMVGQEARVSQAVISKWLSLKYDGVNSMVS